MPQGVVSRGDLLRALLRQQGECSDITAPLLGYQRAPRDNHQPTKIKPGGTPAQPASAVGNDNPLPTQRAAAAPALFWQPISRVSDAIDPPQFNPANPVKMPSRVAVAPPPYRYLASFEQLVPRLRHALSEHRPSRRVDIPRMVLDVSKGRQLRRVPRHHRSGWGSTLYVIEDRSAHLAPYLRDQAMVQMHLSRLYASSGLHTALYNETHPQPRVYWPDGRIGDIAPRPGDQVLVLGDLGALARDGGQGAEFWTGFGEQLADSGVTALALLPCAVAECPARVAAHYHLLSWEHPAPIVLNQQQLQQRGGQLLDHLSVATRIEPRLLREIRVGLGAERYPARLEAWAWQHPETAGTGLIATGLASEPGLRHQRQLQRQADRKTAAASLCSARQALSALPYEIWLQSVLNFADWDRVLAGENERCQGVIPTQERDDALQLLEHLASRASGTAVATLTPRGRQWLKGFFARLSDEVKQADETRGLCWVLERSIAQGGDRPPPVQQRHSVQLFQQGGQLHLLPQEDGAGSPLAGLESGDGLIRWWCRDDSDGPDAQAFWQIEQPPTWADTWGEDGFGPWVEFVYRQVRQRLRWIPPGAFLMGSPEDEPGRYDNEGPQHPVTIADGFWLFDTPVTQALWQAVMDDNPSRFQSPQRPVEQVSWQDCSTFLDTLNRALPGLDLGLPSEAQWEYACRAGSDSARYTGPLAILGESNGPALDGIAWYGGNSGQGFELENGADARKWPEKQYAFDTAGTHPVAGKAANAWGLYDMLGNVWEWTADAWHDDYSDAPQDGSPRGAGGAAAERVLRGGSWDGFARDCRCACRFGYPPGGRVGYLGFRPARVQVSQARRGAQPAPAAEAAPRQRADQQPGRGEAGSILLSAATGTASLPLPEATGLILRSDREVLTLRRRRQPQWASAMGRDRFGLWADITVIAERGAVRQRLRWIPPGRFMMGSPEDEPGRYEYEGPQHRVTLESGYWLFDTPVTQALWQAVMGKNPSHFKSPDRPVEQVSWDDCAAFLTRINQQQPGLELVMPSEAQWEHACRAGTDTALYSGPLEILGERDGPALDVIAWYGGNSGQGFELDNGWDTSDWSEQQYDHKQAGTHPVARKAANAWGLYDMLGNVWEWTADEWHQDYSDASGDGSPWAAGGAAALRVVRGGSWLGYARDCRCACRDGNPPDYRDDGLGFRPARVQS